MSVKNQILADELLTRLGQIAYILLLLSPGLGLLVAFIRTPAGETAGLWNEFTFPGSRQWVLLNNSLALAAVVALGGTLMAALAAMALARWRLVRRGARSLTGKIAGWLLLAAAALPPYLHALAWSGIFRLVDLPGGGGWFSAAWVQTLAFLPLAVMIVHTGIQGVDDDLVMAARVQQSDEVVLMKVILPLAFPWILAAAAILFLLSLLDYSIPYLFGRNTYALEIFASFSASHQPVQAMWTALPLILAAVMLLALVGWFIHRTRAAGALTRPLSSPTRQRVNLWPTELAWPAWLNTMQLASITVLGLALGGLLGGLLLQVQGLPALASSIGSGWREAGFTLACALAAGVLCLPLAQAAAQALVGAGRPGSMRTGWVGVGWWLVTLSSLALPPALVAIGQTALWSRMGSHLIYGQDAGLVLGHMARFTPLAALVLAGQSMRQDRNLLEAARLYQRDAWWGWWRVRLPILAPGWLAAASLVVVLSAGELAATVVLVPPGRSTLTLRIFNFMHYGSPEAVAGLSLLLVGLGLCSSLLLSPWQRRERSL